MKPFVRQAYILCLAVLFACDITTRNPYLPSSAGKPDEVVIVMDSTSWNGATGEVLRHYLRDTFLLTPQPEPLLAVRYVPAEKFKGVFRKYRNILMVGVQEDNAATWRLCRELVREDQQETLLAEDHKRLFSQQKQWAKPQLITYLIAPDEAALQQRIRRQRGAIIRHLRQFEREVLSMRLRKQPHNDTLQAYVQKTFGIALPIRRKFKLAMRDSAFCWLRYDDPKKTISLLVYTEPYETMPGLNLRQVVDRRDRLAGRKVSSHVEGSRMITDTRMPLTYTDTEIDGRYAIEVWGAWRLENDFMGGPFVHYTILDDTNDRVICVEGFIYAPGEKKLPHLRWLQAAMMTMRFTDD